MPTPYPQLTTSQKDQVCAEVRFYFAAMLWIQSGYQARTFIYQSEQLNLFEDRI